MWLAWDAHEDEWVSLEQFWLNHAQRAGGLRWGYAEKYPVYAEVEENDLIIITTPGGICLMEFFHQRWRRANDVRRWDSKFNQYAGCADVHQYRGRLRASSQVSP